MNRMTVLTVMTILITELCERLTYYSITGNLVLYIQAQLKLSTSVSVTIDLVFIGIVYFIPFFGGWFADAVTGRFNTIYGSFLLYFIGSALLPVTAFDFEKYFGEEYVFSVEHKRIFYFIGLAFIAIGTGGIKANVSPFGAQQLSGEGRQALQTFFNWFYWFINVGSAIAFSIVVYIQQSVDFFVGYLIPAISILLGLVIFMLPRNVYLCEQQEGSAFTDLFLIIIEGLRKKRKSIYKFKSFLDYARIGNGGNFTDESVDGLITIARMLPIFGSLIIFWTIYAQGQSNYIVQAERMNINLGSLHVPVASLNLFNTIIILIATPLVDRVIFPIIAKIRGSPPSMLARMGFGLLLAASSSFVAGGIEIMRKRDIAQNGYFVQRLEGADATYNASYVSVLYQIPQFMLIGLGEIFTSITGMEFAFAEAPDRMKGVLMGICLCTSGAGSFLGSALQGIVSAATMPNNWVPNEMNDGHFEYFCFLLGGLMIVNAIIYVPIAKWYKRKKDESSRIPMMGDTERLTNSTEYGSVAVGNTTPL